MALELLDATPVLDDFTPLSEYSSQTPGSFFGGKAVLHLHAPNSTIKIPIDQFNAQPDFQRLYGGTAPAAGSDNHAHLSGVDVWVTSRHVLLFAPAHSAGLQVSYPTITITAQVGQDVLLELNLSDNDTADEDIQFVQVLVTAGTVQHHAVAAQEHAEGGALNENGTTSHNDASTALFKAISDCQELNPDPPQPGEEGENGEAGFDETAPGATGWITSENMADFMDESGNFRMPEGMTVIGGEDEEGTPAETLGAGAGRTRTADELDAENGAGEDDDNKWQRTG
jgi:nucleotide-sensitive chloride channel 1A